MKVTLQNSSIDIPKVKLPNGSFSQPLSVDLTAHQGRMVRVYMNKNGQTEINPQSDSYWLIAECNLPAAQTEQVQNGTRVESSSASIQAVRTELDTDTVPLTTDQHIGNVGFRWARFIPGIDYTATGGQITWLTGARQPQAGDEYPVEIVTLTTVPVFEQRALPLDLTQHAVTLFDLPV